MQMRLPRGTEITIGLGTESISGNMALSERTIGQKTRKRARRTRFGLGHSRCLYQSRPMLRFAGYRQHQVAGTNVSRVLSLHLGEREAPAKKSTGAGNARAGQGAPQIGLRRSQLVTRLIGQGGQ